MKRLKGQSRLKVDAIGANMSKIEKMKRYKIGIAKYKMVFLTDLPNQWPWNGHLEEYLDDKEIYTHSVNPIDRSNRWRVEIPPCLPGFAYVGFRVITNKTTDTNLIQTKLTHGMTQMPMFGNYSQTGVVQKEWTPLPYPLNNRILAIHEDGLDLNISFYDDERYGKVEFLAQEFEEFHSDMNVRSHAYLNEKGEVVWLHTNRNYFIKVSDDMTGYIDYSSAIIIPLMKDLLNGKYAKGSRIVK